jgi:hypothetical protein
MTTIEETCDKDTTYENRNLYGNIAFPYKFSYIEEEKISEGKRIKVLEVSDNTEMFKLV